MGDVGCGMRDVGWGCGLWDVQLAQPGPAPRSPCGLWEPPALPLADACASPALGTRSPCARSGCLPPPGWDPLLCSGSTALWQPQRWLREQCEGDGVWPLEAVEKTLWRQEQSWGMMCRQFGEGSGRGELRALCEHCVISCANASVFTQPVTVFRWTITLKFLILISFFSLLHFSSSIFPLYQCFSLS